MTDVPKSSDTALQPDVLSRHTIRHSVLPLSSRGSSLRLFVWFRFLRARYSSRVARFLPLGCRRLHPGFAALRFLVTQLAKGSVSNRRM